MKTVLRLGLAVALFSLGVWIWSVFHPNPETVIRKRLATVAALLSFGSDEGQIARIANVQQLAGFFSTDIEISVDTPNQSRRALSGREELAHGAMAARMSLSGLKVQFVDLSVTLSADKKDATVDLTGEAHVPGDRDPFVQELKFFLRKIEDKWIIVRVETVRTLT